MDFSFKEFSSKCKEGKGVAHSMGNAANREISFGYFCHYYCFTLFECSLNNSMYFYF